MNIIEAAGVFQTRRVLTSKLIYTDDVLGATQGGVNFGDVQMVGWPKAEKPTEISIPIKGGHQKVRKIPTEIDWTYTFTLGQMAQQIIAAIYRGTQGANTNQMAVTGGAGSASIAAIIPGGTYALGVYDMSSVVITNNAVTAVAGVDYILDAGAGLLYVLPASTVLTNAHTTTIAYNCAAVKVENYTPFTNLVQTGNFLFHHYDQYDQAPAIIDSFHGQLAVSKRPEANGTKQMEPEFEATADGIPTVQVRG